MLQHTHLDAVLVASPPATHGAIAEEAISRGLGVLVEKPLADAVAAAERLHQRALERGVALWVCHNRRFARGYQRLRTVYRAAPAHHSDHLRFALYSDPSVWPPSGVSAAISAADALADLAVHEVDLVSWLCSSPLERVRARILGPDSAGLGVEIDIRLTNGAAAICAAGYSRRGREIALMRRGRWVFAADIAVRVAVPRQFRRLAPRLLQFRRVMDAAVRRASGRPGALVEAVMELHAAFAATVRGGTSAVTADGAAGVAAVRAIDAARKSSRMGGTWVVVAPATTPP